MAVRGPASRRGEHRAVIFLVVPLILVAFAVLMIWALSDEDFGPLLASGEWLVQEPDERQWVWTDDYSNIIGAVIRHLRD